MIQLVSQAANRGFCLRAKMWLHTK